jgi:hypothetical protein
LPTDIDGLDPRGADDATRALPDELQPYERLIADFDRSGIAELILDGPDVTLILRRGRKPVLTTQAAEVE